MKLYFLTGLLFIAHAASSQIVDRKKEEVKDKSGQRVENRTSEAIDKGLDNLEKGIGNIFRKKDKNKKKKNNDTNADRQVNPVDTGDVPDFTPFKESDFVPGQQVLFFEDFQNGLGQWEINEWDRGDDEAPGLNSLSNYKGTWYKLPRKGIFFPVRLNDIPEEVTVEYDLYADFDGMSEMEGGLNLIFVKAPVDRKEFSFHFNDQPQIQLDVHPSGTLLYVTATREYGPEERVLYRRDFKDEWKRGTVRRIAIARKKAHISLYIDGKKYIDLPNGLPAAGNYTLLFASNMWGDGLYFTNIRIASGAPNAVNDMGKSGKFVTNSIYFDVNSSRIKASSWPTLKEVAAAIQSVEGAILISGHTDSDGDDALNLALSAQRAEAVKAVLVQEFGIAAERLRTEGKGESDPVEPNTTAGGKAKNRRVEFTRQ